MSTATLNAINAINSSLAEIAARIDALQAASNQPRPRSSMNPTVPLRRGDKGALAHAKVQAFRIAYTTQPTSKSLSKPKHRVKTVAGLNELDAELNLRKSVREEGLYLHSVITMEPVA